MSLRRRMALSALAVWTAIVSSTVAAKDPPAVRAEKEGFAVLRVVHNGGYTYDDVIVEPTGETQPRAASLGYTGHPGVDNPATYAGWLQPGEYRFKSLASSRPNDMGYVPEDLDLTELALPTFTVEAGEMLDLGTFLQQPVGTPEQGTDRRRPARRVAVVPWSDEHAYGQGWHNRELDEAASAFSVPPTRWNGAAGWNYKDVPQEARAVYGITIMTERTEKATAPPLKEQWAKAASPSEFVAISKHATVATGPPDLDAAGNAYFPSALGQILRRTPGGEWSTLDTGTMDTLSSILIDGRNIYASSLQHKLLASTDGGVTWASAPVPIEPSINAIARLRNGDFVAATETVAKPNRVIVLRGPNLLALPAEPWKTLPASRPISLWPAAMMAASGDRLVLWTGARNLHVYDSANDRWTSSSAPDTVGKLYANRSAGVLYASGTVYSAAMVVTGVVLKDGLISSDGGNTWEPVSPGRHTILGFRDRMNGIAVVADLDGMKPTLFTATTADGGKTWTRAGAMVPGFCATGAYLPPTGELICMGNDGNIHSARTGEKWVLERAVL